MKIPMKMVMRMVKKKKRHMVVKLMNKIKMMREGMKWKRMKWRKKE